jgi:hypothetical protein
MLLSTATTGVFSVPLKARHQRRAYSQGIRTSEGLGISPLRATGGPPGISQAVPRRTASLVQPPRAGGGVLSQLQVSACYFQLRPQVCSAYRLRPVINAVRPRKGFALQRGSGFLHYAPLVVHRVYSRRSLDGQPAWVSRLGPAEACCLSSGDRCAIQVR